MGTGLGMAEGLRVETSVINEPASTASVVVLRLVARVAANELLFSAFATDAAYSVPVVLTITATIVKSDVQM